NKESAVPERLDIKGDIIPWHYVAKNFFHDVLHRDDSFSAAKFVNYDAHPLGASQKELEQLQRSHRLGDEGRSNQFLCVMFRRIEHEQFHIDEPKNLIGRVGVDR